MTQKRNGPADRAGRSTTMPTFDIGSCHRYCTIEPSQMQVLPTDLLMLADRSLELVRQHRRAALLANDAKTAKHHRQQAELFGALRVNFLERCMGLVGGGQ